MAVVWFCPVRSCDAYGQDNEQARTDSFGDTVEPCKFCQTALEWRPA